MMLTFTQRIHGQACSQYSRIAARFNILRTLLPLAVVVVTSYLSILPSLAVHAQPAAAPADTSRHWYDTLTVTKPRYARESAFERIALSAFTALAIPVGATIGAFTLFPPSINLLVEDGELHPGVAISTGISFGGDTSAFTWFPSFRLQPELGLYARREQSVIARLSMLHDIPLRSVHERDFFFLTVSGGGGASYDGSNASLFAEGWFGVANPQGIRFITLYPMHNYGLRLRGGYDMTMQRPWYEAALSATATF